MFLQVLARPVCRVTRSAQSSSLARPRWWRIRRPARADGRAVGGQGGTTCLVPVTVMPPLDTTKPRSRSRCLSTPQACTLGLRACTMRRDVTCSVTLDTPLDGSAFGSASCSPALRTAPSCSALLRLTCAHGISRRWGSGGDPPYKRGVTGSKPGAPTQVRGLFASSRERLTAADWLMERVSYGQVSARQPRSGEVRSVLGGRSWEREWELISPEAASQGAGQAEPSRCGKRKCAARSADGSALPFTLRHETLKR
jgi:hypothetical protein